LASEILQQKMAGSSAVQVLQKSFPFFIICWVLNESIVIDGFVASFVVSKSITVFWPYLGLGLLLNFFMMPKGPTAP